ncbi:MAG TPA: hypothetical protein VMV38_01765 [Candidatus Paceibacterota bacterium]|nr:hypothetical protein [Candidatus Paceibacterota bacterium]
MKQLFWGIAIIILIGVGGFMYRNAVEHPYQPIACPLDAEVCPDGTSVSRTGLSCTFPVCPPPNVSLTSLGIAFAVPDGFIGGVVSDGSNQATYQSNTVSSTTAATIEITRYGISASSTALAVIQQTATSTTTGMPMGITSFSSTVLGNHRFTLVTVGRAGGTIDTAYYFDRGTDVLRFDAIDTGVSNWADPNSNLSVLPAHAALIKLLATLKVL